MAGAYLVSAISSEPAWASQPRQEESSPGSAAEFVICDHTIEPCFEESQTALGMDHYTVRKSPGWYHHLLTSMLAHFFLWHLKGRVGKKAPARTVSQLRTYTIADVLASWPGCSSVITRPIARTRSG